MSIVRTVVAYWMLLITVRAIGRRPGGQMTPFEFVLIFFIGGISIQAVVVDDHSFTNAFLSVGAVAMMHVLVTYLKGRFPKFGIVVDGSPVVVFEHGQWHEDRMRHHGLQRTDILAAARAKGLEKEDQIKYAILERNGEISVVRRPESQ